MSYQAVIIDCVTRRAIKQFDFRGAACRGRTPPETACDLARRFGINGDYFIVFVATGAAA